jgi:hypothetical protein
MSDGCVLATSNEEGCCFCCADCCCCGDFDCCRCGGDCCDAAGSFAVEDTGFVINDAAGSEGSDGFFAMKVEADEDTAARASVPVSLSEIQVVQRLEEPSAEKITSLVWRSRENYQ